MISLDTTNLLTEIIGDCALEGTSHEMDKQKSTPSELLSALKAGSLAFAIMTSPVTAIADPWFLDSRRRDPSTVIVALEKAIGRKISRSEALRIADEILFEAEKRRLTIIEKEAAIGFNWSEL